MSTTPINVRMPTDLLGTVDDLAAREGTTRTALLVAGAEEQLRRRRVDTGTGALLEDHVAYRRHRDRLREALADLRLTPAEAALICDALNGHAALYDHAELAPSGGLIALEVQDSERHEAHGLDDEQARALVRRLAAMSPLQALAVADAAERFWAAPAAESALRAVGLVQG